MHRPFFKILSRGQNTVEYDPHGREPHSRFCKIAAVKIANIFRIFKINYTDRCLPISAVHPAFTAAITHLLDYKTAADEEKKKACQRLRICIDSLYGMNINWDWANRSIRAIHSLASQWNLDLDEMGVNASASVESVAQFRKYESSCVSVGGIPDLGLTLSEAHHAGAFDAFFEPWTHDNSFLNGAFDSL